MEVRPFGILVSVSYPPDTDTPGRCAMLHCYCCMYIIVVVSISKLPGYHLHISYMLTLSITTTYHLRYLLLLLFRLQGGDADEAAHHPRAFRGGPGRLLLPALLLYMHSLT